MRYFIEMHSLTRRAVQLADQQWDQCCPGESLCGKTEVNRLQREIFRSIRTYMLMSQQYSA